MKLGEYVGLCDADCVAEALRHCVGVCEAVVEGEMEPVPAAGEPEAFSEPDGEAVAVAQLEGEMVSDGLRV